MRRLLFHASVIAAFLIMIGAVETVRAGGVRGRVWMAPMCPGPARIDRKCPPKPVLATVDIFRVRADGSNAGTPLNSIATNASGGFEVTLPPGHYRFVPRSANQSLSASGKPTDVVVKAKGAAFVTLTIDTGLR